MINLSLNRRWRLEGWQLLVLAICACDMVSCSAKTSQVAGDASAGKGGADHGGGGGGANPNGGDGGAAATGGRGSGGVGGAHGSGGAAAAVDYTSWTDCGQDGGNNPAASKCVCDAVNQCAASTGWIFQALGSDRYRICGYREGQCVISAFHEVEGDGKGSRCLVALEANPCTNGRTLQDMLAARCTQTFQCNIMIGNCPADPIACPP